MSISVVTLGSGTWELVERLERLHGEVTVVRRCLELSELLACAHTGMAQLALVAEGAEDLTASLLDQLASSGLRVLVVEGHDDLRLFQLGVGSVPAAVTGSELSERILGAMQDPPRSHGRGELRDDAGAPGSEPPRHPGAADGSRAAWPDGEDARSGEGRQGDVARARGSRGHTEEADHGTGPVPPTAGDGVGGSAEDGGERELWHPEGDADAGAGDDGVEPRLVVVWGPAGAPGRTVVAINLAAEAALHGARVLLVDADTYAASVAASLGMLDEAAGLAQACRLADQGRLDADTLRRCATPVSVAGGSVAVLSGLTRHDRWPELRASALELVLERARQVWDLVVVDVSSPLEADEEISTDFLAPRRNAGALSAVAAADTVIALGAADALGVPRLVKALPDLDDAAPGAAVLVVMNKLRPAATGRAARAAVTEAWERFSPGHPIAHTLPWDPAVCDAALLAGAVLAETAPRSALRQEITALALAVRRGEAVSAAASGAATSGGTGTRLGRRMGAWLRRD
ncbi:hypothetical protein M3G48_10350 [Kocuria rhizophila]|uniref:AAA family ATPase n=1 Tax=Kocuria rhizophila TaxID=72000 RepID=UPI0021A34BE8|nr:hypothetical protein [Kocuria rhizophila]MCT1457692.1 hypothetical protein [Kocuria rhizophila]